MESKLSKFKKIFEEININGDGKISFHELSEFMATEKAHNELHQLTDKELETIETFINDGETNDLNATMTFEEFLQVLKENETMNKLVLKIADLEPK